LEAARRRPHPIKKAKSFASKLFSKKASIPKLTGHFIPIKKSHSKRNSKFSLLQPRIKKKLSAQQIQNANKIGTIRFDKAKNVFFDERTFTNPLTGTQSTVRREWQGPDPRAVMKDIADPTFGLRLSVTKTVKFREKGRGKTSEKVFERTFDKNGKPVRKTIERKA